MGLTSSDGREIAASALKHRDLSERSLARRLRAAGASEGVVRETLEWLGTSGYVDDARLARTRALALAEKGYGDAAIALRLARDEISRELQEDAIAGLEPEHSRARKHARGSDPGQPMRLAAMLTRRGFSDESVEAALLALDAGDGGELR